MNDRQIGLFIKIDKNRTSKQAYVLKMPKRVHDNLLMREILGLSYMTFGAILEKLACNAVKAGIACRKSRDAMPEKSCELMQLSDKTHMKKCYCQ